MVGWILLLGAMLSWTVHFFASYTVSITIGGTATGKWIVLGISLMCLAANAWLLVIALRALRGDDDFSRWLGGGSAVLLILSTVAILFQTLPVFLT